MSEWPKSYVYFARGVQSGLIKIGKSEKPLERMRALESQYKEAVQVIFVAGGNIRAEREYHKRFSACHERGEWFREEGKLAAFIKAGMKSDLYIKLLGAEAAEQSARLALEREPRPPCGPQIIGYARVSTEEQVLDVQMSALKAAGCHYIFSETISAVSARRPEFNLMLKHVERGDTIVVYAYSRISRDLKFLLSFVDDMRAAGVKLKSTTEPHIDPYTTNGRLLLSVTGAVDENERGRVRDRTRDAMQEKIRGGMYIGRPRLVDEAKAAKMRQQRKTMTPAKIAAKHNVSISTVNKYAPAGAVK